LSVTAPENSLALRQKLALHQGFGGRVKHEGGLAAVTVGRVILAAQRHVAAGEDRRQRRSARGLFGHDRLDAGKNDLAAVGQAEGARIDDLDDAAFALRFECASRGVSRASGDNEHETARRHRRNPMAATPCPSGHGFHHAALCPDQLRYAGDPQTRCLSEIVLLTKGARWKSTASRIFF
jgi:hypothetical protein